MAGEHGKIVSVPIVTADVSCESVRKAIETGLPVDPVDPSITYKPGDEIDDHYIVVEKEGPLKNKLLYCYQLDGDWEECTPIDEARQLCGLEPVSRNGRKR